MLQTLLRIGVVQVITMLVLLVRTKSLAVSQGPEFVGTMAVIDKLIAVIVQSLSVSLPYAAVRFLPERWKAGPAEYRQLYVAMRNTIVAIIVPAGAVALAVTVWWPERWGVELAPYRGAMIAAFLGLPVAALLPFLQNAFAGRLQQHRAMTVSLLHATVLTASVAGAWKAGLIGYYAAYAILGVALVVIVSRTIVRDLPDVDHATIPLGPMGLPANVWRFGGYLLVLTFAAPYASLFVHYRLLSVLGAEGAGWMQAAMGIGLSVRAVLGSAHAVFLTPNVNTGGVPADRMRWADNFQLLLCLLAGLTVPLLLLLPGLAVTVLYSSTFAPGAAFVLLFVINEVLLLLAGTYQALVVALDRMRAHVINSLIAQALVIGLAWWLVRPYGILGAGISLLIAPCYLYLANIWYLHREYQLQMSRRTMARSIWLVVSMGSAGVLGSLTSESYLQALPAKALLYAVVVCGFWILLTSEERTKARHLLTRVGGRWSSR